MPPSLRQKSLRIFIMASSEVTFLQMQDPRLTPILKTEKFTSCPFSKDHSLPNLRSTTQLEAPPAPCEQGNYQICLLPAPLSPALKTLQPYFSPFPPRTLSPGQAELNAAPHACPLLSHLGLCPPDSAAWTPLPTRAPRPTPASSLAQLPS